jgi:hypothetical protein
MNAIVVRNTSAKVSQIRLTFISIAVLLLRENQPRPHTQRYNDSHVDWHIYGTHEMVHLPPPPPPPASPLGLSTQP